MTDATDARCDGDNEFERLDSVIPKVEDWHASRILYQVKNSYCSILAEHITFIFLFATVNMMADMKRLGARMGSRLPQVFSLSIITKMLKNYYDLYCTI